MGKAFGINLTSTLNKVEPALSEDGAENREA